MPVEREAAGRRIGGMTQGEEQPARVEATPNQPGEASGSEAALLSKYPHAERCVWSARMLRALDEGVKGGRWFSLIDKVWSKDTLARAWEIVRANDGSGGIDGMTTASFATKLEDRLLELSGKMREGTYGPQPVRRVMIPKADGRKRPLGVPTIQDRIVQTALRLVIEPIFEREFKPRSFGFRPGRGCKDALREVVRLSESGHTFVVDADIKSFFDTIPHDKLMRRIEERISDGKVLRLVTRMLEQGVMDGMSEWTPGEGTPQGSALSPLLANIYLHPLDALAEGRGYEMVRYADDFVVLCRTREQAEQALQAIQEWTADAGLVLHPEKTRIVDMQAEGASFEFLGYRFERNRRWPRKSSVLKLREAVRKKTPRNSGHSMMDTVESLNRTLRGWFEYFKHSSAGALDEIDGFVRRRLRAILSKRNGIKPAHLGEANIRWPNVYFRGLGLFSLSDGRSRALAVVRNRRLESRMREIRTSGSEGGGA
jgi:RNA-directed DNA polymerase